MKNINMNIFDQARELVINEIISVIKSVPGEMINLNNGCPYDYVMGSDDNDDYVSIPYKYLSIFIDGDNQVKVEYMVLSFTDDEDVRCYNDTIYDFSLDEIYVIMGKLNEIGQKKIKGNGEKSKLFSKTLV